MTEDLNNKYYYPQPFFFYQDLLEVLYGSMHPFIEVVHKNSDYSQLGETDNREAILENIKMLLKLFEFEIDDIKKGI